MINCTIKKDEFSQKLKNIFFKAKWFWFLNSWRIANFARYFDWNGSRRWRFLPSRLYLRGPYHHILLHRYFARIIWYLYSLPSNYFKGLHAYIFVIFKSILSSTGGRSENLVEYVSSDTYKESLVKEKVLFQYLLKSGGTLAPFTPGRSAGPDKKSGKDEN